MDDSRESLRELVSIFLMHLPALLTALPPVRLLVVDHGSRNSISERVLRVKDLLVRLPTNMGLGVGTHVAIDHALRNAYQILV